jgi:riboflavin synthase
MFTGIIEEVGTIKRINKTAMSAHLIIEANKITKDLEIGDSLSTNGVCLTVTDIKNNLIHVDVMNETIQKSTLFLSTINSKVNLERALKFNSRLGGHIVSGHIDGRGTIISIRKDDIAIWYKIKANPKIMRYIIDKGSITIDGISLTVAKITQNNFSVSIVPHTINNTILSYKKIGSQVNLENDLIGKYVEKLISPEKKSKDFFSNSKFY